MFVCGLILTDKRNRSFEEIGLQVEIANESVAAIRTVISFCLDLSSFAHACHHFVTAVLLEANCQWRNRDSTVNVMMNNGQTLATVQFSSHTRNSNGVLVDGNYQLEIDKTLVTNLGTPMEEDFVFGDVEADGFFSFFGDSNGNRSCNIFDLLVFRQSYLTVEGGPDYQYFMDFEDNGIINIFDLLQFRSRYGQTLPFVFDGS